MESTMIVIGLKEEIEKLAKAFLKNEFNIVYDSIHVLIDQKTLIIRVDDFLCPAEVKTGVDKKNAVLIQEMYSRLFDKAKDPFVAKLNQMLFPRCVASVQTGVNFETRVCLLTFILGSNKLR